MSVDLKPAPRRRSWEVRDGTGRTIEIAGLEWGSGRQVALLLHANGFCAATWTEVAERLADHCRVIALDARGHGSSTAPPAPEAYDWGHLIDDTAQVVQQLRSELGIAQIALCAGNSLGGVIGAALASELPGQFGRVVMLDPPLKPSADMLEHLGLAWPIAAGRDSIGEQARRRRAVWPSRAAAGDAWRAKPMFATWDSRSFELYLQAGFRDRADGQVELSCAPAVEASIFEMTGTVDLFERAPRILTPVHLVRATRGYFPRALYQALVQRLPRGALSEMDGGHLLPMEMPESTAELLQHELDELRREPVDNV